MVIPVNSIENILGRLHSLQPAFGPAFVMLDFFQEKIRDIKLKVTKTPDGKYQFTVRDFFKSITKKIAIPSLREDFMRLQKIVGKDDFVQMDDSELN